MSTCQGVIMLLPKLIMRIVAIIPGKVLEQM